MRRRDFSNTIAALAEFDRTTPERDSMCDSINTEGDVYRWMAAVGVAEEVVQRAFHEDTKDLNNWSHCKHVTIKDAKRVDGYTTEKTPRFDALRHIPR